MSAGRRSPPGVSLRGTERDGNMRGHARRVTRMGACSMSTDFDKFAILDSFLDEVASYLPEIEANLDRLQQRPGDQEAIEETFRRAHTIGGSAAMMEFSSLARVAQGMEEILGRALDSGAPLDAPSIALLRRSCGRLTRLMEQVRTGGDGTAIAAEDDADRAAARGSGSQPAVQAVAGGRPVNGHTPDTPRAGKADGAHSTPGAGAPPGKPHLPGWLAAFGGRGAPTAPTAATPAARQEQWAPSLASQPTDQMGAVASSAPPLPRPDAPRSPAEPSFDEMIQAFRGGSPDAPQGPAAPTWGVSTPPAGPPALPGERSAAPAAPEDVARTLVSISPAWEELQVTENAVRNHVAALRDIVATLREASKAMEDERAELRTFLDGSKDALDRLEDWAGQAMGLNLRQSPEHVRRYLPLSVIWVTTTRLKKLVTVLNNSGRSVTASQESINEALDEMHASIENVGRLFSSVAAVASAGAPGADGGFRATVAQVTHFAWSPPATSTPPSVSAIPTEPPVPAPESEPPAFPAEPPTLPPGARAEMERTVREELRRELEDEVRAELAATVRREEEARLRQELEIQVRRRLLAELTPGAPASAVGPGLGPIVPPLPAPADRAPQPVRVTEQSAEALDVFREEAEEHLQHIAMGIRQLEDNPRDQAALQSVRRATHTLKGAAGMMGLTAIQQLSHSSEDLLDRLSAGALTLTPEAQGLLLDTSEALERLVGGALEPGGDQERVVATLERRYSALLGRSGAAGAAPAPATRQPSAPQLPESARDADAVADLSVRLRLSKLDELINLFGDLLQNRTILDERLTRLGRMIADTSLASQRLREVGSQLETRFEAATLPSGRAGGAGAPFGEASAISGGLGGVQPRPGLPWGRGKGNAPAGRPQGGGPAHLDEFHELELDRYTEFHRLSRGLSEGVSDMVTLSSEMETMVREVETILAKETRLSAAFQDRLMKARLVPLDTLVPRLYRAARAAALKQGKEVEFFVEGGATEVDRTVYEEVAGPLLHLVRNAVVHGIERPDVRQRAGKSHSGHIYLSAAEEGNQVVITVRDDGAGVDPERVRVSALARGLIDARTRLTAHEALNLIFQPGLSTADTIDEESGRGVGLDVVRDAVARLRGTIEVDSNPGQGTMFVMRIPVSLQITRVVLARVGKQVYAIPMAVVQQIGRLDYYERVRGGPPAVEVLGNVYPLAHLASYLNVPHGPVDEKSTVLLYSSGRQRMALVLDAIAGRQEVVVKNLGPHLRDVRGISGATVLGDGKVVLILNLAELLSAPPRAEGIEIPPPTGSLPRMASTAAPQLNTGGLPPRDAPVDVTRLNTAALAAAPPASATFVVTPRADRGVSAIPTAPPRTTGGLSPRGPRPSYLLVVDDSPSVRRVVGNMLRANGWEVQTARDGIEALEAVARQMPAAVLLDIEMPRMDGYELMATLRSQPQYRQLPLIVLTSRAAAKHQQRATQLGANAYVVKPYQDEELLSTLDTLVAEQQR
jgi:chemotaxis protein histidine kinase CheA/CheY-like chemotaxis protein